MLLRNTESKSILTLPGDISIFSLKEFVFIFSLRDKVKKFILKVFFNFCQYLFEHSYIYMIKQDIRIYVANSRPNVWTDRAELFCGHSWAAGGVIGVWNLNLFIFILRATPGPSANMFIRPIGTSLTFKILLFI